MVCFPIHCRVHSQGEVIQLCQSSTVQLKTVDSLGSITSSTAILLSCTKFTCMYLSDSPVFTYRYDFRLCRQCEVLVLQLWCRATGTGGDREHYPENNMPSTCRPVLMCKVYLYTVPAILTCVYLDTISGCADKVK